MKANIYILLFIFVATISCNKPKRNVEMGMAEETISIVPTEISSERMKFSDLFDSIHYIFIPTDSNFLIGKVDKLLVSADYIFIMDQKVGRAVFGINKNGEKILYLNKRGRGPGDYGFMTDIAFSKKQELLVYCNIRQCIIHYDLNGNFLLEEKVPFRIRKFYPIDNAYAFHCEYYENSQLNEDGNSPNIFLFTPEQEEVREKAAFFAPPVDQSLVLNTNCQFSAWGDTVSIKPDHSDIVYHIIADKIIPKYKLDFGDNNINDRYWKLVRQKGIKYKEISEFVATSGICESFWFLESSKYAYFSYKYKSKRYDVLYSKKTKQMKHLRYYENDMDKITLFLPKAIYGDKLYCLLKSEEVHQVREVLPDELPEALLNQVDEFGNPVIVELTIKPF